MVLFFGGIVIIALAAIVFLWKLILLYIKISLHYIPKIIPMLFLIGHETFRFFMTIVNEFNGVGPQKRKEKKLQKENKKYSYNNRKEREQQEWDSLTRKALENRISYLRKTYPMAEEEFFETYIEHFQFSSPNEIKEQEELIKNNHLKNKAI